MEKVIYREAVGTGAIEFTKQYMTGLREFDELTVEVLLDGRLHDTDDKRVKRCDYCGYYWRDDSLRNTRKTCSEECRTGIKTIQRQIQRERKQLLDPNPPKRTLQDDYYWWYEYPFWVNEYSMIKIGWKFEKPISVETFDAVHGNQEIYGMGNKRITTKGVMYDGDKDED